MKKIALIMAMQGEALPLINHFDLKQIAIHKPSIVYANNDRSLILSLNGFDEKNGVGIYWYASSNT